MKTFKSADGTTWNVTVVVPGSSNAMILFRHPDGSSSGRDRYNWVLSQGPEARSVTGRLAPRKVLDSLGDSDIATLFRRSMPVSRVAPRGAAVQARGTSGIA